MYPGEEVFTDYGGSVQHPFLFLAQYGFYLGPGNHDMQTLPEARALVCKTMQSETYAYLLEPTHVPKHPTEAVVIAAIQDVCAHQRQNAGGAATTEEI